MAISASILKRAIELYLGLAYPGGNMPADVKGRVAPIMALGDQEGVAEGLFEVNAANSLPSYALRLGQPMYPFMKLVVEPAPCKEAGGPVDYLVRVDTHDRHLHAAEGSPDAAWLAGVRASNRELTEKIEGAWGAAGLPTFKEFLRRKLEERKAGKG